MTRPTHLAPTRDRDEVVTPCTGRHELFDSNTAHAHAVAARICAECPFIAECDTHRKAVIADHGTSVYGGAQGTWAGKLVGKGKMESRAPQPRGAAA